VINKDALKKFPMVTGFFSDTFPSDPNMAPGVDSAPSENEYQEYSWG